MQLYNAGLIKQSVSLIGLSLGPIFAVNMLGMLTTNANWQGTLIGLCELMRRVNAES